MTPLLSLEQAQEKLLTADPLPAETLPAEAAVGRYLAAPLVAARTQPAADLSAMDGYVVPRDELAGPWRVVGESAAGHPWPEELKPGEAIRISTGALLPPGGGSVLLQENATRAGDRLSLNGEGEPNERHIRRAGFDFAEGSELLVAGTRIGPAQLALALAAGRSHLSVHRLPTLAVLDSGDELASDPASCRAHQVPASNGAMLAAMSAPHVAQVQRLGPVPDRMEAMLAALDAAGEAEVIVTSGGASVGDHDLVRPALERWGATIDFWRVAIRPGKPLLVARKGPQWIIGLPGNPVSSYVTAFLFLLPLLRQLGGATSEGILPRAVEARVAGPMPETGDRDEFVRGIYRHGEVRPLSERDSSALRTLAAANALIRRRAGSPALDLEGQRAARIYLLENGGIA